MFKRITLFLATNMAVLLVITVVFNILNLKPFLSQYGIDYKSLLIYALIAGFAGSLISLFSSKSMALRSFNIQLIDKTQSQNQFESWLTAMVEKLAKERNVDMPDVGIYQSPEPNAFATGWNKNSALLAVSSGLLQGMNEEEVEAVLGHEVSHIANGDMVTLALIQGVVNTFVVFFARVASMIVMQIFSRREENQPQQVQGGFIYQSVATVFQLLFGVIASLIVMWFSRYREYRADAGSAQYVGKEKMISALQRLQEMTEGPKDNRAPAFNAMKISAPSELSTLFASHPPIEKRIEALRKLNV